MVWSRQRARPRSARSSATRWVALLSLFAVVVLSGRYEPVAARVLLANTAASNVALGGDLLERRLEPVAIKTEAAHLAPPVPRQPDGCRQHNGTK